MNASIRLLADGKAPSASPASASGSKLGAQGQAAIVPSPRDISPSASGSKNSFASSPPAADLANEVSQKTAQAFVHLVDRGIQSWIAAGELLVVLVKERGAVKVFDQIRSECAWMTQSLLWNFYKIGTHELYPHAMIVPRNAAVSRRIASLPWATQKQICEKGLAVVDENGNGFVKKLADLDLRDITLAIGDNHIRSIADQKKIVKERGDSLPAPRGKPRVIYPSPSARPAAVSSVVCAPLLPTVSAGAYRVTLDLNTGEVRFDKHQGQFAPGWIKVMLAPDKGKLVGHFILLKPDPK